MKAAAGVLIDGFTVPEAAVAPMFPDEDGPFTAEWDLYGQALTPELRAAARREQEAGENRKEPRDLVIPFAAYFVPVQLVRAFTRVYGQRFSCS